MGSFSKLFVTAVLSIIFAICTNAQDLGSSNKLFGGGKKSAPATTPKKTVKKVSPKATTSKRVAPAKKVKTTPKQTTAEAKQPKTTPKQTTAAVKQGKPEQKQTTNSAKQTKAASKQTKTEPKQADTTAKQTPGRFTSFDPPKKNVGAAAKNVDTVTAPKTPGRDVSATTSTKRLYEQLIEDGNLARDERRYGVAESAYKRAAQLVPKDPRAVYGLGNLYSDQQRWDEAETAYRSALELAPKDVPTRIALSYVLTQPLSADNLSDRYAKAEQLATTAIKLAPQNALAFDQLGAAMELRGLINGETENAYRQAIRLDPSFAPAYAHLGRLLRRRGMKKDSDAAYQMAVARANDAPTKIVIAEVLQSEQRYSDSEKLLRSAIAEDPQNPAALFLLGQALTTSGSYDEAERVLRQSLDRVPNGFRPNSMLATLYLRQNKLGQAESSLIMAARSTPESEKRSLARSFEAVGDAYFKAGKRSDAARCYRMAATLDADNSVLEGKIASSR